MWKKKTKVMMEPKERKPISGKARGLIVLLLFLLLVISLSVTVFCGLGTYYLMENDFLGTGWKQGIWWQVGQQSDRRNGREAAETEGRSQEATPEKSGQDPVTMGEAILTLYLNQGFSGLQEMDRAPDMEYSIYTVYGRRLGGTLATGDEAYAETVTFSGSDIRYLPQARNYKVKIRFLEPEKTPAGQEVLPGDYQVTAYWEAYSQETFRAFLLGLAVSVILILLMGLVSYGGHSPKSLWDKVPADFLTVMVALLLVWLVRESGLGIPLLFENITRLTGFGVAILLVCVMYLLHMFVRTRRKNWYHCCLCYFLYLGVAKLVQIWGKLFQNLKLIWKLLIVAGLLSLVELILMLVILPLNLRTMVLLGLWALGKAILLPFFLYHVIVLTKLQQAAHEVASGNLSYQMDLPRVPGMLRGFSRDINSLADSVSGAVEDRLKSERLKTELITNVSHDIKTPLTSIINFSDLITREETDNPKISEYAQHLNKQSVRLKKLIEDLMEASKASTGNLETHLESCDMRVLLGQCIGEYEPRLLEHELELIVKQCDEPIQILADTRMLWRIFDNLMNNICKYAQRQTRVYLSTEPAGDRVRVIFKNISKYALDVSAEDLMERFVRGDLSRHTEGNGLGLSIVRSLMELQGGKICLVVDGDLFKAILEFPIVQDNRT